MATDLRDIEQGQAQAETVANANFDAVSPAGIFAHDSIASSGLVFEYYGGVWDVSGTLTSISADSITLTDSSTNYIEVDAAGTVVSNTSAFTPGYTPLYIAVTSGGSVTGLTDQRAWIHQSSRQGSYLSVSFPSDANMTLTAAQARARHIRIAGTISTVRNVVVPLKGDWHFTNETAGSPSSAIQVIGATGTGVIIAHNMGAFVFGDGTNIKRATADAPLS